jgi:hypothetical protein
MATGILGIADLAATTLTTLYTVPSTTFTVATVSVCNRGTAPVTVRIALAALATPTAGEYIEYDMVIQPKGVLERTGLVLDATKKIVMYASATSVSATAFGIETSTV